MAANKQGGETMFANNRNSRSFFSCKGFTLLEVLIVVLIAVMVTMFSVPAYRKAQERNRYLAAVGVLMEVATAAQILHEEYPEKGFYTAINRNKAVLTPCPDTPNSGIIEYLQCNNYLNEIPFDSANSYKGYLFVLDSSGWASCGKSCSPSEAYACMYGSNLIDEYTCAWVDKAGMLHNNK